jgi:hypothetical protein
VASADGRRHSAGVTHGRAIPPDWRHHGPPLRAGA